MTAIPLETLVTVFGGSGFLGRHVVRALAKQGYRIRVAVRRPELAGFLQPLGRVGQIHAVQANLRYPTSVEAAARDADVVINLVGILFERGRQKFDAVQAYGAEAVALAAAAFGARMIHVSAIGADENSPSHYARSKAAGEKLVLAAVPSAVILRPSVLFGPEDDFLNKFAAMARLLPALPLVGGGHTRFQPIFAGDVAGAVTAAIEDRAQDGRTYELGGPEVKSFKELMQFVLATIERRRAVAADPVRVGQAPGGLPAADAQAVADAGPGRAPAQRHHRVGPGAARRPHARSARHRPRRHGHHRAVLSLAVPQERPIPGDRGRQSVTSLLAPVRIPPPARSARACRRRRATTRTARSRGVVT